jgi:hypothetical protein
MKPNLKGKLFWIPAVAAFGLLAAPMPALATQAHGDPEGIVAHQIAHVVFIVSMAILIYWLRKRLLVKQAGWKYIQYAALFFILWNMDAFLAHILDEQLGWIRVEKIGFWQQRITAVQGPDILAPVYYLIKRDHLLCVPAMIFLYMGLNRLLRTLPPENTEGSSG